MSLGPGTRLGVYEVIGLLGAGGMGEVYRARDTKLRRDVALKVLPDAFAADPDRVARFTREAHVLATLNHPHIAAIYGVEESGGVTALVLELVDGPTLAERIGGPRAKSSGLPVAEALTIAAQIADALDTAHEKGIVHRDLKPANIKLTADDQVKVLDFGLAKALADDSRPDASLSPTMTAMASRLGVIVGTAAYMSPEQAKGKPVDKRTDVWAFGCVLYEMLSGRRAFDGEDVTDLVVAVMTKEPDWAALPATTPPRIVGLLRRCLRKNPRERVRDIGDARISLEETEAQEVQMSAHGVTGSPKRLPATIWMLAMAASFAVGLGVMRLAGIGSRPNPEWSGILLGGPEIALHPRVSPDGRLVAFHAMVDGQTQVAVMQPGSGDWTVLTRDRTRGIVTPMSWSTDGTRIYYGREDGIPRGVFSVPAVGGEERLVLEDAKSPEVLPDGSLLVHRRNEMRQLQIYRFWPESGRLQAYPGLPTEAGGFDATRAFRDGRELVFAGRSLEQPETDPNNYLYAVDLVSVAIRRVSAQVISWTPAAPAALGVSADDQAIVVAAAAGDLTRIVQIPRRGGPARDLTSVTQTVWGLDVGTNGDVYVDQVQRPQDALLMDADGGHPQTILTTTTNFVYVGPTPMADGRVLFTVSVGGRNRLLAAKPRENAIPFVQTTEETSGPATMVGSSEVAFLTGSGPARTLAIAAAADGRITRRLDKADGPSIQALTASPDGQTLYYAAAGKIWAMASNNGQPRLIHEGDGVAADPGGRYLIVQLNEKDNVRLVRVAAAGGPEQPLSFPGVRLAPVPMPGNAVRADGAILKTANASDTYPWYAAVLNPDTGTAQRIRLPSFLDTSYPGWTIEGKILSFGAQTHASIWRLRPATAPVP